MKFQDLPVEVQTAAAETLQTLILEARFIDEKKSFTQQAQEVRSAFVELYQQSCGGECGKVKATNTTTFNGRPTLTEVPAALFTSISENNKQRIVQFIEGQFVFIRMNNGLAELFRFSKNKDAALKYLCTVIHSFHPEGH